MEYIEDSSSKDYCSRHRENPSEENVFDYIRINSIFPSMFFHHSTCYARWHYMSSWYWETEAGGNSNSSCSDKCRRCGLWIVHFVFSDFFTYGFYNPLPSDHSTWSYCNRNHQYNPPRHIISCLTEIIHILLNRINIYRVLISCISIFDEYNLFSCIDCFEVILNE